MVHLTSLHLHNIRCFPYEIFAICTSLTKVFLEGGCIVHAEYYDGRLEVHPHADEFEDVEGFEVGPRLRELTIENNQYFTKLLIRENCLISLNQLQKLRLKLHDPGDVKRLASMIPLFGEALEELWLRLLLSFLKAVHFLHLVENFLHPELFQNLRSFSMALDETPLDLVAPAWIASFLAALPNPQRFEELGIELLLSFGGYFQYHQVNAQDIGWRELDRILGLDRFPWLSGVEVSLYEELANRRVPLSQDKADEFLEAVLPNSWANGIVSVA
ncbi:hypothetical protein BDN72DRAFT_847362 [Pluteus cervinus]|uniref:Uncharacterized protein n=1 Tax=Pluteus cervinus TaxID=181527 RepID=A0ACD3ADJ9_9AGAR|nr:hypothetical protein BDN72DRAFT_847362 [Pluteus cervinus]